MVWVTCSGKLVKEFPLSGTVGDLHKAVALSEVQLAQQNNFLFVFKGSALDECQPLCSLNLESSDHIILLLSKKEKAPLEQNNSRAIPKITNIQHTKPRKPVSNSPAPIAKEIAMESISILVGAGFPPERAKKAYLLNGGDVNAAMEWLLDHIDDPSVDDPLTEAQKQLLESSMALSEQIATCLSSNVCTYCVTGPVTVLQPWYICRTCNLQGETGCCASCALTCHRDHDVIQQDSQLAYCDCSSNCQAKTNGEN